jgi:methionyl-tRNA formyltransferase
MSNPTGSSGNEEWRVVIFTNIQQGLVYHLIADVVHSLGHRVVGVVTSPGPKERRDPAYLDVVAETPPGIEVLVTTRPSKIAPVLAAWEPDLIIVGGFPLRLPPAVLDLPRLGAINLHPALLPRHRGRLSFSWMFRNDDREMGFTVHRMAPEFDTGPILAQIAVPIDDDDDVNSLLGKCGPLLPGLLAAALERVARGESGEPQDESLASETPELEPEWRFIDWSRPARTIHNQVRSWTGTRLQPKGAFGNIEGETVLVLRSRLVNEVSDDADAAPGTIIWRDDASMRVQCGDGSLDIVEWERAAPPGKET